MEHPITPPPGLVEQWRDEALNSFPDDKNPCPCDIDNARDEHIATQAARWGAAQELEACSALLEIQCERGRTFYSDAGEWLRTARRPKTLSLNKQAIDALEASLRNGYIKAEDGMIILRALESIPDTQD